MPGGRFTSASFLLPKIPDASSTTNLRSMRETGSHPAISTKKNNAESEKEALELADLILKSLKDTVAQHCDAVGFGQLEFLDNDSDPWVSELAT